MADIAKVGSPSPSTTLYCPGHVIPELKTGEAIAAGDACYIKTSDRKIYKSTGAAANAAAQVHGFAPRAAASGEALTLLRNVTFGYGSGLSAGTPVFLSGATAGALADAASTGGWMPIGFVVDDTRIHLTGSTYPVAATFANA
jgi:hypothetical protein